MSSDNRAGRISVVRNSVFTSLLFVTSVVTSLVMAPVIVQSFGAEAYGVWELMLGLVGYLSLLDLGISPAIVRYVAVAKGSNDRADLQHVFSAGLAFSLSIAAVGVVALGIAALFPSAFFNAEGNAARQLQPALLLFALTFACNYACAAPVCYLLGAQRYVVVNAFRIAQALVQTAVSYYVLTTKPESPLVALAMVTLCGAVVELLFFICLLRTDKSAPRFLARVAWPLFQDLFRFGAKSTALVAANSLLRSGVLFVLAHVAGVGQVVYFVFPMRLLEYAVNLGHAVGAPLTPYLAHAFGENGGQAPTEAWLGSTRALQFVTFGVSLGVIWLGLPFIGRWLGQEYAERGAFTFTVLCVGLLVRGVAVNANRLVVSLGLHGPLALSALVLGIVCLIAAIPLVESFGIAGAAIAVTVFWVVQSFIELRLACRHLGIQLAGHVSITLLRYGVPFLAGSLAFHLCRQIAFPTGYPEIIAHALLGGGTFALVSLLTALSGGERRAMWGAIKSRVGYT